MRTLVPVRSAWSFTTILGHRRRAEEDRMKRWLILLLLLLTGAALAQNTPTIGVLPDNGPSLPATCVIGQIYFRTATTIGLNQCNPANTWTALVAGSGAGVTSVGLTVNGTSPSGIFTVSGSPVTTSGTLDVAL